MLSEGSRASLLPEAGRKNLDKISTFVLKF